MTDATPTITRPSEDLVVISPDPINQETVTKYVSDPSAGAVSLFIGTTRNHFDNKEVVELRYEAYVDMALKQLREVCRRAREQWDICRMAVVHRTGVVPVGEASIIIAVSSTHRQDSLATVTYAIEAVKSSVTIWKKEIYREGGNDQWKANKECFWQK